VLNEALLEVGILGSTGLGNFVEQVVWSTSWVRLV